MQNDDRSADDGEQPIPAAWRPAIGAVVEAFVRHDYVLADGVAGVRPVAPDTAAQIRDAIADYGETLIPLPDETWDSSVRIWTGHHWDVFVDLWTLGEGCCDLVLSLRAFEPDEGPEFEVHAVYVP